jgi:hypothetical protein
LLLAGACFLATGAAFLGLAAVIFLAAGIPFFATATDFFAGAFFALATRFTANSFQQSEAWRGFDRPESPGLFSKKYFRTVLSVQTRG